MSEELVANFTLNNETINADYEVSEGAHFDALLSIDSQLDIQGEGLINVTKTNGVAVVTSTTYIHEQGVASDTWEINHNLNKYPSVTVIDTAGTIFSAQVEYNDENTCTVYINGATKGKAFIN